MFAKWQHFQIEKHLSLMSTLENFKNTCKNKTVSIIPSELCILIENIAPLRNEILKGRSCTESTDEKDLSIFDINLIIC